MTMNEEACLVQPIELADLVAITPMVHANMTGVDMRFTELAEHWLGRWTSYLFLPLYLLLSGQGYKAVRGSQIVGYAFLRFHSLSAFVFNVGVNRPYRRQGVGHRLMMHLEEVAQTRTVPWMALQVDANNVPAHNLYRKLGYQAYHPHYLRCKNDPPLLPEVRPGLSLATLGVSDRRLLFERYAAAERHAGDASAADVAGADYAPPFPWRGRHWRCLAQGREAGYAWWNGAADKPAITLLLNPEFWGDPVTLGFLRLLLERCGRKFHRVDVDVGSYGHYKVLAPLLRPFGFQPRTRSRLLMLKSLGEAE